MEELSLWAVEVRYSEKVAAIRSLVEEREERADWIASWILAVGDWGGEEMIRVMRLRRPSMQVVMAEFILGRPFVMSSQLAMRRIRSQVSRSDRVGSLGRIAHSVASLQIEVPAFVARTLAPLVWSV